MSSKLLSDVCYSATSLRWRHLVNAHGVKVLFGADQRRLYLAAYLPVLNPAVGCTCALSKLWPIISQIFAIDRGVPHLMPRLRVIACEYPDKLYLTRNKKDCSTRCCKPHDRIFIHLDKTPKGDGQTDRRTELLQIVQRSALYDCKQCGRAVKMSNLDSEMNQNATRLFSSIMHANSQPNYAVKSHVGLASERIREDTPSALVSVGTVTKCSEDGCTWDLHG